jgi:hypothetical protein
MSFIQVTVRMPRIKDRRIMVNIDEIGWVESEFGATYVHLRNTTFEGHKVIKILETLEIDESGKLSIIKEQFIPIQDYGSSGYEPIYKPCPAGDDVSCVSGSGDGMCGGFMGTVEIGGRTCVRCLWKID